MNKTIEKLNKLASNSPYPITFKGHSKRFENDEEDYIFISIKDSEENPTFQSAYKNYISFLNTVENWEEKLIESIISVFEWDLENRKLVSE